ncbi:MAG: hypothetical protein ABUL58_07925 [Steroidobacter sp.]
MLYVAVPVADTSKEPGVLPTAASALAQKSDVTTSSKLATLWISNLDTCHELHEGFDSNIACLLINTGWTHRLHFLIDAANIVQDL